MTDQTTTPLPIVNKVRIADDTIYINGEVAGQLEGTRGDVYIIARLPDGRRAFVARMKYCKPRAKARAFIKAVFARVSMADYLERLSTARDRAAACPSPRAARHHRRGAPAVATGSGGRDAAGLCRHPVRAPGAARPPGIAAADRCRHPSGARMNAVREPNNRRNRYRRKVAAVRAYGWAAPTFREWLRGAPPDSYTAGPIDLQQTFRALLQAAGPRPRRTIYGTK